MEQIAIYLRLSKEDEFVKDESNSITNQRAFIRGFINKNKELRKMSVVEFVDDGIEIWPAEEFLRQLWSGRLF